MCIRDSIKRIEPFIDKSIIKVITGQRRIGKSYILLQISDIIKKNIPEANILFVDVYKRQVQKKTMARSFVQQSSSFGGRRGGMPVQYVLQATTIEKLQEVLPKFMTKVYENPVFQLSLIHIDCPGEARRTDCRGWHRDGR